jgi:hypothetical protein
MESVVLLYGAAIYWRNLNRDERRYMFVDRFGSVFVVLQNGAVFEVMLRSRESDKSDKYSLFIVLIYGAKITY